MDDVAIPSRHEISKFRVYTLGIVAINKALSSKVIEFTAMERTPMANGELTDHTVTYKAAAVDDQGGAYNVNVDTTATMKATWLPLGDSNRRTAPDVRRGEQVVIYQFGDSDQYWWMTQMDDFRLRKLETVIYGWSATKDEKAEPSPANMYFLEISTHTGQITFKTSKANGEPFAYTIQLNTKQGFFAIQDDDGQTVFMDSKERQARMENRDGSYLEINKRNGNWDVPDNLTLTAGKAIAITAGTSITGKAGTTQTWTAGGAMSYQGGGIYSIRSAGVASMNSFSTAGGTTSGPSKVGGSLKAVGDIQGGNVSLNGHTHPGDSGGTTGGPNSGGGSAGDVT